MLTECSKIRNLNCYQNVAGESLVTCQWVAEPPAPLFEIVFSMTNGSEVLRKKVSSSYARAKLGNLIGSVILVSVRNISTRIRLLSKSRSQLFEGICCPGQPYSAVLSHDPRKSLILRYSRMTWKQKLQKVNSTIFGRAYISQHKKSPDWSGPQRDMHLADSAPTTLPACRSSPTSAAGSQQLFALFLIYTNACSLHKKMTEVQSSVCELRGSGWWDSPWCKYSLPKKTGRKGTREVSPCMLNQHLVQSSEPSQQECNHCQVSWPSSVN